MDFIFKEMKKKKKCLLYPAASNADERPKIGAHILRSLQPCKNLRGKKAKKKKKVKNQLKDLKRPRKQRFLAIITRASQFMQVLLGGNLERFLMIFSSFSSSLFFNIFARDRVKACKDFVGWRREISFFFFFFFG